MATKPALICYEASTLYIDYEDTVLRLSTCLYYNINRSKFSYNFLKFQIYLQYFTVIVFNTPLCLSDNLLPLFKIDKQNSLSHSVKL